MPLFWAIVLTIIFHPIYLYFLQITNNRKAVASLLTIFFIVIAVVVPIYFIGVLVANEAVSLYINLTQTDAANALQPLTVIHQLIAPISNLGINTTGMEDKLVVFAQKVSAQIGSYAFSIGKATFNTIVGIFIMLYILFFTLKDGEKIGKHIMHALPLGDEKERLLFSTFTSMVRAMFKGTFIIAAVQGSIGGLLFAIVGIPSALLWAVVMTIFAIIPAVGPAIVWIPAALFLFLSGHTVEAFVVFGVGVTIISLIDNLLRPILVSKDTTMPDVLILLSVLGGLTTFGVAGIIVGPVVTALFLAMWELFEHDYARELKQFG